MTTTKDLGIKGFSVQVSDTLFLFPDTRNLTPDTLGFGAWDAVTVHHLPFTVFCHSASVSTENHCAALNWVIGVGFPEVETSTVKWVVD